MVQDRREMYKKLMVFLLAGIMISSVFGVIFFGFGGSNGDSLQYNGFEFVRVSGGYQLQTERTTITFSHFPSELSYEVQNGTDDILQGQKQFLYTSDFHDRLNQTIALVHYNLAPLFQEEFGVSLIPAYTSNVSGFPAADCRNATAILPVILTKSADISRISLNDSCIVLEAAEPEDLISLHELILYRMLGVIEGGTT
ncbi:MAG TPA: hypothetical protein VJB08_00855 [Candidatus Nanoarchaeia archaeon]|nr:hypothetical protein [Candidatus Nanoarchaeia archaeon]